MNESPKRTRSRSRTPDSSFSLMILIPESILSHISRASLIEPIWTASSVDRILLTQPTDNEGVLTIKSSMLKNTIEALHLVRPT